MSERNKKHENANFVFMYFSNALSSNFATLLLFQFLMHFFLKIERFLSKFLKIENFSEGHFQYWSSEKMKIFKKYYKKSSCEYVFVICYFISLCHSIQYGAKKCAFAGTYDVSTPM